MKPKPVSFTAACRQTCAVARRLRYRTLDRAVGQRVRVTSEPSAVVDVLEALAPWLPPRLTLRNGPAPGLPTVAKYALLDIELSLSPDAGGDLPRLSRQELRDLGVLVRAEPRWQLADEQEDGCLAQLLDEVTSAGFVVKLMLDAVDDERSVDERLAHTARGLPPDYLPRVFEVRDACITNGPLLWLERHFYM